MWLPIPIWCLVVGSFAFIAAFSSKSFWGIAVWAILGGFLWFLAIKEWRYRNRKRDYQEEE
jgi:uncharacterized membrane protein HdeD (DUF308 family)